MGAVTGIIDGFRIRSGEMTFLDRLDDLRGRLIASFLVLAITTGVGFYAAMRPIRFEVPRRLLDLPLLGETAIGGFNVNLDVLSIAIAPILPYMGDDRLKYLSPTEPFFITLKLAICIGFALALPFVLYQFWALIGPLLRPPERRLAAPAVIASVILFLAGAIFCYLAVIPLMFRFTLGFQSGSLEPYIVIGEYLKIVLRMLFAFGVAFELPVVILLGTALGLVTPEFLASKRRHAIAIATVIAAVVTPPDLTSLVLMMIPVVLLYELGIVLSRAIVRRRAAATAGG